MRAISARLALALSILLSPIAHAFSSEDLQFSGFGTIGLVLSDSDVYGYRVNVSNDDGVFAGDVDFLATSNLGLQLDAFVSSSSQFTFQVLLKEQARTSFDKYVTQAFYKVSLSPSVDVRIGRTPFDIFALTEYRDVGFGFPWAAMPGEVYGIYPVRSLDGADFSYTFRLDAGTLFTKLFVGQTETEVTAYRALAEVKLDRIVGLSVTWSELNWELKANYSHLEFAETPAELQLLGDGIEYFNTQLDALTQLLPDGYPDDLWLGSEQAVDDLVIEGEAASYASLSGKYSWDAWTLAAEITKVETDNKVTPELRSAYLSLAFAQGKWTYYGLVADAESDTASFDGSGVSPLLTDPDSPLLDPSEVGSLVASAFQQAQPAYQTIAHAYHQTLNYFSTNQRSYALGCRYDLRSDIAVTVQLSHTVIDDAGGALWWVESEDLPGGENVNTAIVNMSFVF